MKFSLDDLKSIGKKRTAGRKPRGTSSKKPRVDSPVKLPLPASSMPEAPAAAIAEVVGQEVVEVSSPSPPRSLPAPASATELPMPAPSSTHASKGKLKISTIEAQSKGKQAEQDPSEGGEVLEMRAKIHGSSSVFEDKKLAEDLLHHILLPRDQERWKSQNAGQLFDDSIFHLHGLIHSLLLLKERYLHSLQSVSSAEKKAAEADQQAKMTEGLLKVSESREAKLKERLKASRSQTLELEEEVKEGRSRLKESENYILELERRLADATSQGMISESRLLSVNHKLEAVLVENKDLEEKVQTAEARVQETEARAASIGSASVEEFKSSDEFRAEVGEAAYDAYVKGFSVFREQVQKAFPELDFSGVRLEEVGEEAEEEEEIGGDEGEVQIISTEAREVETDLVIAEETAGSAEGEARPNAADGTVRETVALAMAEIDAAVEALKK